jgi:nitrate reductase gamma subunit
MTFAHNLATHAPYNYRTAIGVWWRSLFYLQPNVAAVSGAPIVYQLHAIIVWLFWASLPFSRLVHAWSIPLQWSCRRRGRCATLTASGRTRGRRLRWPASRVGRALDAAHGGGLSWAGA